MTNRNLFEIFRQNNQELYEVGGCVRDSLLGVESNDIDYATSAYPNQTINILRSAGLRAIPIGIEFGTIQTIVNNIKVEITTYRCAESYTKGSRKPGVTFGSTIEEDLARRDFTINAIARKHDGSLIDPFNGANDLAHKIIRTPIDPLKSFTDDPLRILRGIRFYTRGLGNIEYTTWNAMVNLKYLLHELSAERVFEEINKLLLIDKPSVGLKALHKLELLAELFPELQQLANFNEYHGDYHYLSPWEHTLLVVDTTSPKSEVRWAGLFHDVSKPDTWSVDNQGCTHYYDHNMIGAAKWDAVATRLKVSNAFRSYVGQLIEEHMMSLKMGDKGARRLIDRLGSRLDDLFDLAYADINAHTEEVAAREIPMLNTLKQRVTTILQSGPIARKFPRGTGTVVAEALGISPGPQLGQVMTRLTQMLVDGDLRPDSDVIAAAKEIINEVD